MPGAPAAPPTAAAAAAATAAGGAAGGARRGGDAWKPYWGAHQRFFKLLCVSLKVPTVVEEVRASAREGAERMAVTAAAVGTMARQ